MAHHPGTPRLRLVGSSDPFDVHAIETDPVLPRWAVYGLITFYCAAAWSLAFWIVSAWL